MSRLQRPGWRRWLSPGRLVLLLVWGYLLVKLAPHLAAVVGIETGDRSEPVFAVETLGGETIASDSLRGKVLLVNFWATWCLPCRVEMPLLEAMARRHRDRGLVVLGFSVDRGSPDDVAAFLAARGISYPVAITGAREAQAFGGIVGYPTSFLVDRQGRLRHRALGPLAMASFEPAVRRLLDEEAVPAPLN